MLDLNRLIGISIYGSSPMRFREIKEALLQLSPSLETDDVAIVLGLHCEGSGEITGAIANAVRPVDEDDFVITTKAIVKTVGEAEINSPKIILIISDTFSGEMDRTLRKLFRLNATYDYESKIHVMQLSSTDTCEPDAVRVIVEDVTSLTNEVKLVLEETIDVAR